ncbi:hypothetical protein C2E21_8036 [Chlorella sorokiniana]|uniref:Galactose-1-phosphate uridylyltransferase n=1 Tax=Chlorella sorokiniana TaxID=3076 RepID=A0A2P6TFY8_CHLSO|nr:hypothetical protein C2E21_8036 [Chlorella sorokiniana]|eukprot:PRW33028.1 hypothetical protein C2E21_8036 [Chlorella sorokiniana]
MAVAPARYASVFELAKHLPNTAAFNRIFEVQQGYPRCKATPQLQQKYGVPVDNTQHVLRISNRVTLAQCWFNEARTRKPQTFATAASEAAAFDATGGGENCDFCRWQELTAEDTWGRVEGPHAVSASNLFKYSQPCQGVVLFKHHDPLQFNLEQLQDLVNVSQGWFQSAAEHEAERDAAIGLPRRTLHPLLVWNALPRGGASQYHGHAQVLLSEAQFPFLQQEREAVEAYDLTHGSMSRGYYQDVLAAHADCGLLLREGQEGDYAFAFPSLSPWKDMEVCVHGSSMASPAFQRLLYTALRALIDELGVATFNAAIYNIDLAAPGGSGSASGSSVVSGMGGSTPSTPSSSSSGGSASGGSAGLGMGPPGGYAHPRGMALPVVARVVSRGKLSNLASDFGGLEVFGGASIGHTDPCRVAEALRQVQEMLPPM